MAKRAERSRNSVTTNPVNSPILRMLDRLDQKIQRIIKAKTAQQEAVNAEFALLNKARIQARELGKTLKLVETGKGLSYTRRVSKKSDVNTEPRKQIKPDNYKNRELLFRSFDPSLLPNNLDDKQHKIALRLIENGGQIRPTALEFNIAPSTVSRLARKVFLNQIPISYYKSRTSTD